MRRRRILSAPPVLLVACLAAAACDCGAGSGGDGDRDAGADAGDGGRVDAGDGGRLDTGIADGGMADRALDAPTDCRIEPRTIEPCEPGPVACDSPPPECPDGYYPARNALAECWAGYCAPCDIPPGDCGDSDCEDPSRPCPDGTYREPEFLADGGCEGARCVSCSTFCEVDIQRWRCRAGGVCAALPNPCPPWQRKEFVIIEEYDDLPCFGSECVPCDFVAGPRP